MKCQYCREEVPEGERYITIMAGRKPEPLYNEGGCTYHSKCLGNIINTMEMPVAMSDLINGRVDEDYIAPFKR